jgi:sulfofructosephosphate aldolase
MTRRSLAKIARQTGALAMVAVDQREALRGMFATHQTEPVADSMLTQFKVDVARELTPYASARHHQFQGDGRRLWIDSSC